MSTYNGWKNYATWNVALWIGNDEGLYRLACDCADYDEFVEIMRNDVGSIETPDQVAWNDRTLDTDALDAMFAEFRGDDNDDDDDELPYDEDDDDDVDTSGYDYNWHGYGITITTPSGSAFMQGEEAAELYDQLEAATTNREWVSILMQYEHVCE